MSKGLNLGLEKLEAELKRHTLSKCLNHIFLTLLAPLTAIISGFGGTASLSYLVLGADPSTHHAVQTQPWSKTTSSPFTCITPSLLPPLTQGYNSAQVNFQPLVSISHFCYKFISKCCFVWCPEHSKTLLIHPLCLPTSGCLYWEGTWSWGKEKDQSFLACDCISLLTDCTLQNAVSLMNFANVQRQKNE